MQKTLASLFTGLSIALASFCALAQNAQLDLNHVAEAALAHSPALRAARAELRAVQELYPQALANWHPSAEAEASVTTSDIDNSNFGAGDGATTKDITLSLNQPLYRGGRSTAQKKEAKARIAAQIQRLNLIEQQVLSDSLVAAVDAVFEYKNLIVQSRNEDIYRELMSSMTLRRQAGELSDTDIALTQSRLLGARAEKIAAETQLDNALTTLEEKTGIAPALWTDLSAVSISLPATIAEVVELAKANNPLTQEARYLQVAEEYAIPRVKGELYPTVGLFASWNRQYDPQPGIIEDARTQQVGVRATVPLYEGGATRSRVRVARNRALQSRFDVRDRLLDIERQVISEWRLIRSAAARHAAHVKEVQAAESARKNITLEMNAGEKTLTDQLQADQAWLEAHVDALAAARAELTAQIRLAALVGTLGEQLTSAQHRKKDIADYQEKIRFRVLTTSLPDGIAYE